MSDIVRTFVASLSSIIISPIGSTRSGTGGAVTAALVAAGAVLCVLAACVAMCCGLRRGRKTRRGGSRSARATACLFGGLCGCASQAVRWCAHRLELAGGWDSVSRKEEAEEMHDVEGGGRQCRHRRRSDSDSEGDGGGGGDDRGDGDGDGDGGGRAVSRVEHLIREELLLQLAQEKADRTRAQQEALQAVEQRNESLRQVERARQAQRQIERAREAERASKQAEADLARAKARLEGARQAGLEPLAASPRAMAACCGAAATGLGSGGGGDGGGDDESMVYSQYSDEESVVSSVLAPPPRRPPQHRGGTCRRM